MAESPAPTVPTEVRDAMIEAGAAAVEAHCRAFVAGSGTVTGWGATPHSIALAASEAMLPLLSEWWSSEQAKFEAVIRDREFLLRQEERMCATVEAREAAALAEVERLRAENADYRTSICFEVTCTNCARMLDLLHATEGRAETAEAERDEARAALDRVEARNVALVSALDRTVNNFKLAVMGKPVRDMTETLAEVEAALSTDTTKG